MSSRLPFALLPALIVATILAYLPGLNGPFIFDDTAHVEKNPQVHINDLTPASLTQAWNSSFQSGIGARPLAQLSFGINHALAGLSAWHFKAVNLGIHLLTGLGVFMLAWLLTNVATLSSDRTAPPPAWVALLTTALWLLHPINLTPVLYVVQRMTSLATVFVVIGLSLHVLGRIRMAKGQTAGFWIALAGLPIAGVGGLAKESAALYPLLVLALEWTLLRDLRASGRRLLLSIVSGLPLLLGATYLATHLGMVSYATREFTMEERLLTEARVLWRYVQMVLLPTPSSLGFYHDDIPLSAGLFRPWTTFFAISGWLALFGGALAFAKRWPVASAAVLFFLAGHALESTIFPLEIAFEHRNYLPTIAPLFAVAWWLCLAASPRERLWKAVLGGFAVVALAAVTHLRAWEWSNEQSLVVAEVRHHPESARANFRVAQLLMDRIGRNGDPAQMYRAARFHLLRVRELAPSNANALFGLAYLNLFVGKDPDTETLQTLIEQLRDGPMGPTNLTVNQFGFLVKWQGTHGVRHLAHDNALAILRAAADNPRNTARGKASALSALRAYYDTVLNDLETALVFANAAVDTWPRRWHYHQRLVELLIRTGRLDQAQAALDRAMQTKASRLNLAAAESLTKRLASAKHHDAPPR